jgi:hypothetical protein
MTVAEGGAFMARTTSSRSSNLWLLAVGLTAATLTATQLLAGHGMAAAATGSRTATHHASRIAPVGMLDCNGHSPVQRPVKPGGAICAEVHLAQDDGRFEDNGFYVGHDEPTVQFYSSQAGSSTNLTYVQTLPRDPKAVPTVNGPRKDVTHFFELMPTLWYSMALCDANSFPQLPCAPDSDANAPHGNYPGGGSALLELQFYPPGFAPFADALSCDNSHWCGALTIDSLECTAAGICNNNCVEPINFAFVQTNGVPTGPPSPQRADLNTVTPNQRTLLMNPGDKLKIHIFENRTAGALETEVRDLTTGRTGFMLASAKNGFMNTSIADCSGTPWNFRPLYSAAKTVNQGGWAAANINVAYEVGHFTPCTRLRVFSPVRVGGFLDKSWNFCSGPYENAGPPDGSQPSAEPNDAPCFKAGSTHGALNAAPSLVTGCIGGDLDYDGTSYWADWPRSLRPSMFPSALTIQQPTTVRAQAYPRIQFLTDNPATNIRCNPAKRTSAAPACGSSGRCRTGTTSAGSGSTAPSRQPWVYPSWRARSCPTRSADQLIATSPHRTSTSGWASRATTRLLVLTADAGRERAIGRPAPRRSVAASSAGCGHPRPRSQVAAADPRSVSFTISLSAACHGEHIGSSGRHGRSNGRPYRRLRATFTAREAGRRGL